MTRRILFAHGRAPGDVLMFSAGVRDFKGLFPDIAINVQTKFGEIFQGNPHLDPTVTLKDGGVEFYRVGYPAIQGCSHGIVHFAQAFLLDMIAHADAFKPLPITLAQFCSSFSGGRVYDSDTEEKDVPEEVRKRVDSWRETYGKFSSTHYRQFGDIYLTDEEKSRDIILEAYGEKKYWIIAPGGKRDCTCKIWDWRKFSKVVDHFAGAIKFVAIGRSDHLIEPMRGVISMVDKTPSIRDLFPLVYHSEGVISGISFPMHFAAAMPPKPGVGREHSRKPCVAIFGGREPWTFAGYSVHQILHNSGTMACSDAGGCWQSRVSPITKDAEKNNRLCHKAEEVDGRMVPACMAAITADDMIRAIERYYEGGLYHLDAAPCRIQPPQVEVKSTAETLVNGREINLLCSLQSQGGGEQSALKIAAVLRAAGWTIHIYPWGKVHEKYESQDVLRRHSFKQKDDASMLCHMKPGLPLLFYANDQITDFCDEKQTGEIIAKSSAVVVGINYMNGPLTKCAWLTRTGKVRAVVFQNTEKMEEFRRDAIGFESVKLVSLFGAIDLDRFYAIPQARRLDHEPLIVLKHCTPDYRKYVTTESENNGAKIHLWQRKFSKENDAKFYARLLVECRFPLRFEFMEAHKELVEAFPGDPRMVFHKWDAMPVVDFLKRGHVYLYRSSNLWRDQYPRCMAEALAAGLPVLGEPRDGPRDRIQHGDTGFYVCDFDQTLLMLKTFHRKEDLRFEMGTAAKEWAKRNLDPRQWIDVLEEAYGIR